MLDQPLSAHDSRYAPALTALRPKRYRVVPAVLVTALIAVVSIAAYPMLPRKYTATATVWYNPPGQQPANERVQSPPQTIDDNVIETQIDLMQARPLLWQVINDNHLLRDPEFNTTLRPNWRDWLLTRWPDLGQQWPWLARDPNAVVEAQVTKRLTVARDRKSYLIQVAFNSADPDKAARLANTLVDAYFADQLARKRLQHQHLLAAADALVAEQWERFKASEQRRHDFLVQSGLIHRGAKEALQLQLHELSDEVAAAHKRSVEADARAQTLLTLQKTGGLDGAPEIKTSPVVQRLQERLAALESGSSALTVTGGSTSHIAAMLREEIANQRQQIVNAAQADATATHRSEDQLRLEVGHLDAQLMALDENERRASELSRDVDTDSHALSAAMAQRAEESAHATLVRRDAELVAAAVAVRRPSFPALLPYAAGTIALCLLVLAGMLTPTMTTMSRRAWDMHPHRAV